MAQNPLRFFFQHGCWWYSLKVHLGVVNLSTVSITLIVLSVVSSIEYNNHNLFLMATKDYITCTNSVSLDLFIYFYPSTWRMALSVIFDFKFFRYIYFIRPIYLTSYAISPQLVVSFSIHFTFLLPLSTELWMFWGRWYKNQNFTYTLNVITLTLSILPSAFSYNRNIWFSLCLCCIIFKQHGIKRRDFIKSWVYMTKHLFA